YTFAGYLPVMRFDDATAVLAIPEPPKTSPISHAMWLYAQGSAHAWRKETRKARALADQFDREIAPTKTGNNAADGPVTIVSGHVLHARIAIAENNTAAATRELEA